jgi:hypothetical protein
VSPQAKAALMEARKPFYKKIPRRVLFAILGVVLVAALVPVAIWGIGYLRRSKNPEEWAVREQLYSYKFDKDENHLRNIDAMGAKGVGIAIKLLTDTQPAELEGGKSTATAGDLALEYLMHYATKVNVPPPAKGQSAFANGSVRLKPNDWQEQQQIWTAWFAEVQSSGKAI